MEEMEPLWRFVQFLDQAQTSDIERALAMRRPTSE